MEVMEQINKYIESQPAMKRSEMLALHELMIEASPTCKLWFFDGKDGKGKIVSNPNIGYGEQTLKYATGETRAWYQIGISANTTGISVYVFGIEDKKFLAQTYAERLGKASVTGYCVKFRKLVDINIDVLKELIQFAFNQEA